MQQHHVLRGQRLPRGARHSVTAVSGVSSGSTAPAVAATSSVSGVSAATRISLLCAHATVAESSPVATTQTTTATPATTPSPVTSTPPMTQTPSPPCPPTQTPSPPPPSPTYNKEWGKPEYDHCGQELSWKELLRGHHEGEVKFEMGGLGRRMQKGGYETWQCICNHHCATDTADPWFCFVYHETQQVFTPWGPNSKLKMVPPVPCTRK